MGTEPVGVSVTGSSLGLILITYKLKKSHLEYYPSTDQFEVQKQSYLEVEETG